MTERGIAAGAPEDLERSLAELSRRVEWPVVPDLSASVREELERPARAGIPAGPISIRSAAWLAAAALLLLIGALAIIPDARTAIADRLGLRGIQIRWLAEPPLSPATPTGAGLNLGRETTLDAARQVAGFEVLLPVTDRLPAASNIFVDDRYGIAMVSIVYPAGDELPKSEIAGVGALLTQFPGETDRSFIIKGLGGDIEQGEAILETVTVNGGTGFWIGGVPHGVFLACSETGDCREERYRLAGNVLIWEQDGLTLRFESALSRDEALEIARSVQAAE